jgi:hypothetical protein
MMDLITITVGLGEAVLTIKAITVGVFLLHLQMEVLG